MGVYYNLFVVIVNAIVVFVNAIVIVIRYFPIHYLACTYFEPAAETSTLSNDLIICPQDAFICFLRTISLCFKFFNTLFIVIGLCAFFLIVCCRIFFKTVIFPFKFFHPDSQVFNFFPTVYTFSDDSVMFFTQFIKPLFMFFCLAMLWKSCLIVTCVLARTWAFYTR